MPHLPRRVAYFSMEIGLDPAIPTYAGGLGVLAGDTVRSAADLQIPLVAVSLLYSAGYFHQRLDADGWQREEPELWSPQEHLHDARARTRVTIEGREVNLRAWTRVVEGATGFTVPVYLLDADLAENAPADRALTAQLYGGDARHRLAQEIILGIGGVRMLRELGHRQLDRYHMNEGHSSLLTFELLRERAHHGSISASDIAAVRHHCVFTTHTPVPAGHDVFPLELAQEMIGPHPAFDARAIIGDDGTLHTTRLAMNLSRFINAVSRRHGEVSRRMFPGHTIDSITNGVHATTWTGAPFRELYDRHLPGWRQDNYLLRGALTIPAIDLWSAHQRAKRRFIDHVNERANAGFDPDSFTIGFARRATPYKRADILLRDVDRLAFLARSIGPVQIVYGGKAHPRDHGGKEIIRMIRSTSARLGDHLRLVYLPNYDMAQAAMFVAGVDVWVNTPQRPLEASGTSGMKAALNGVPQLSVLDGWWVEGCVEGVTGWSIGQADFGGDPPNDAAHDAASLYDRLHNIVMPLFYRQRDRYIEIMRHAITINGSFFNTQRMVSQYKLKAYDV